MTIHYQNFSYLKLYLTLVAAIITAFTLMALFSLMFSAFIYSAIKDDFFPKKTTISTQQHSQVLQRDLSQLANNAAQKAVEPLKIEADKINKKAQQQASAHRTHVQTCEFWQQQYQKERSDRNKMHVNSACKLAYGSTWIPIN